MPQPQALKRGATTTEHLNDPPRHHLPPSASLSERIAADRDARQAAARNANDLRQPVAIGQGEIIPVRVSKPQVDVRPSNRGHEERYRGVVRPRGMNL